MKLTKVLNLRMHVGGLLGKTSIDSVKNKAEMELYPIGVLVKSIDSRVYNIFVPFANIVEVLVAEPDESSDEPKRGPGRPVKVA